MTAQPVDEHFVEAVRRFEPGSSDRRAFDPGQLLGILEAQLGSRHLDLAARDLGSRGLGYYSIGSSGHDSNAAVAAALRPSDPALLHYRSGAFYLERARAAGAKQPLLDVLLGIVAARDEPISGGRHKVFGSADLSIIPQTSTIASHLPRAVGLAFSLGRAAKLAVETRWPADSVVVCSFGDASANHSTAAGAVNAAQHCAYQHLPMPLLLVCEDNGIGISVRTPAGWVAQAYGHRPGLRYFTADGDDPLACLEAARAAAEWVRGHAAPAFLHLRTVRLMGHAGSDVESGYRARGEVVADYARDPLLATARLLVTSGACTAQEIAARYEDKRAEVARLAEEAMARPRLADRAEVVRPLQRDDPDGVAEHVRAAHTVSSVQDDAVGQTVAQAINRALGDELAYDRRVLVFGEDVAVKGGVYGVTRGLHATFGAARVFDTLLDEQTVLGTALGAGVAGLVPVAEIQYLAYLHNAADQLRGEAATLGFFSQGQYENPMVVRVAGYAYQRGFGGHFHNDNSVAALLDIPGVVVASPSRPEDAAAMLRTCVAAAAVEGRVCIFLEPIALYHTRDLYEPDDGRWLVERSGPEHVPVGVGRELGDGRDLTIVTFGNGLPMSLRVAHSLRASGVGVRVLDLRWLAPLPHAQLLATARATGRVLVVDETRRSGGVSERVVTSLADQGFGGAVARVTSADSFIPLGPAADLVLLDEPTIEAAARRLLAEPVSRGA